MIKNILVVALVMVGCGVEDGRDGSVGSRGERGRQGVAGGRGSKGEKGERGSDGTDGKSFVYSLVSVEESDYEPTGNEKVKISRKSYDETFDGLAPSESCNNSPYKVKYDGVVISITSTNYCISKDGVSQSSEDIEEFGYDNPLLLSSSKVEYEGISGSYLPKLYVYDFKEVDNER